MTTDSTTVTNIAPPRAPASLFSSLLRFSGPFVVLGIVGWINGIGAWPAFRQQDTSLLHWILTSNSEALKGLSQAMKSEGSDSVNEPRKRLRNYLTLENMNLSGLDLSSSDLSDMSLENVNLAGARLVNTDFSCTDLTRVNFSGAKLMNARLDYSNCSRHISTISSQCSSSTQKIINEEFMDGKSPFRPPNRSNRSNQSEEPFTYTCLQATFVGADFSKALIRGDEGRRSPNDKSCKQLLVLVGNMSGAVFNEATLTCVALIHQQESSEPGSGAKATGKDPVPFSYNGISFTEARLDRISLLKGPFRFSQFERAKLLGLYLNIGAEKADLDYSRFNEIECKEPAIKKGETIAHSDDRPCLLVQRDANANTTLPPLHLNLLWSTLTTNLNPAKNDSFLCTPNEDLPAWVEEKRVESASYWLATGNGRYHLQRLDCPATNYREPNNSKYPEPERRWHHVLSPSQSGGKLLTKAAQ
jgi:uncharacterized protein YjbI with pentapeptide repeats